MCDIPSICDKNEISVVSGGERLRGEGGEG